MRSRSFASSLRSLVCFVFVATTLAATGCGNPSAPNVPLSTRPSFGELVYRVIKTNLSQSSQCPTQYVTALEVHHGDFVTTFDYVIEHGVSDRFPELLGGTIKPLVDNDKLPRMVDTLAATLALLVSDEFDPNRDTIHAIVNLSEAQTLLESSMAIQTVAAILEDPAIEDKVHALAVVAQENDGVTYVMDDMLDVRATRSRPTRRLPRAPASRRRTCRRRSCARRVSSTTRTSRSARRSTSRARTRTETPRSR